MHDETSPSTVDTHRGTAGRGRAHLPDSGPRLHRAAKAGPCSTWRTPGFHYNRLKQPGPWTSSQQRICASNGGPATWWWHQAWRRQLRDSSRWQSAGSHFVVAPQLLRATLHLLRPRGCPPCAARPARRRRNGPKVDRPAHDENTPVRFMRDDRQHGRATSWTSRPCWGGPWAHAAGVHSS